MARIMVSDKAVEISDDSLVAWLIGDILSPFDILGGIYWAQYFGMPAGVIRQFLTSLDSSQVREIIKNLDASELVGVLYKCLEVTSRAAVTSEQLIEWELKHVSPKVRTAHQAISRKNGPRRPPWAGEADYRRILASCAGLYRSYVDIIDRAMPLLRALLPASADPSVSENLERTSRQIPEVRLILEVGFEEAIRRLGNAPLAEPGS